MNIYLLRHGETSWNREHRLQGIRNIPLSRAGIRQTRRSADWFGKIGVTRIVTSPLIRAQRTAQILGEGTSQVHLVDDRLREIDHGRWTGLRLASIEHRFPHEFAAWNLAPETLRLPASESLKDVYRRSTDVLMDALKDCANGNLLMVSHGVVNALLLCAALGASLSRIREFSLPNLAASILRVEQRRVIAVERQIYVPHR
jgi:broad specificity phosphatase PhoE